MEFTGTPEVDITFIELLEFEDIISLIDVYDKYVYSLILLDVKTRDQEYKDKLLTWFIEIIPKEYQVELIEYMIENNYKVSKPDMVGYNALILASRYGQQEIVRLLLDNLPDINIQELLLQTDR